MIILKIADMESQQIEKTQGNVFTFIKRFYDNQKAWLVIAIIIISLFVYGEVSGTKYFFSEDFEEWKPNSQGSHRNNHNYRRVNHK